MRMRSWIGFSIVVMLLQSGCSKSPVDMNNLPPMQIQGVSVDTPQLTSEFSKASPELQSKVSGAIAKIRLNQYMQGMAALDEVLNSPGLTDKQKKLLTQVIGQLKEVVTKTGQ